MFTRLNTPLKSHSFFKKRGFSQIRVNTVDHDGCLGLQYMEPCEVRERHAPLIDAFSAQKYDFDYVMSYSNRQNRRRDCFNALYNQNNLAFPVAKAFAKALNAYFDPLLLADIYAKKKPGFTILEMQIALAQKGINSSGKISDKILTELMNECATETVFSEDKLNILYPQTHRMSLIHPKAEITFNILDDLVEQVLEPSIDFYSQYPTLIPNNVTLNFYYLNTLEEGMNLPTKISSLVGEGEVDADYYETVLAMGEIAKKEEGTEITKYKMANYLSPKRILEEKSELELGSVDITLARAK